MSGEKQLLGTLPEHILGLRWLASFGDFGSGKQQLGVEHALVASDELCERACIELIGAAKQTQASLRFVQVGCRSSEVLLRGASEGTRDRTREFLDQA